MHRSNVRHVALNDTVFLESGIAMDVTLLIKAALMGIVEGLTEFLPISSTGHLILAGSLLDASRSMGKEVTQVFEIAIQTGAILAIVLVYWQRLLQTVQGLGHEVKAQRFALNVFVGFLPAAVLGLLLGKVIKAHLFTPQVVAGAFIVGGFIILWAEKRASSAGVARVATVDDMSVIDALKVGLLQCLALVPGTSRSGASIIGGMLMGLSRQSATEFSFFLGIPTLVGAGAYSLYKARHLLSINDAPVFAVGLLFSFLSAWLCVRWLLKYVSSHDFKPFAWYRIAFGVFILLSAQLGWITWSQ
jgi:undecaprenyl-diphosphatase